jgi:phosphoketolase
VTSTPPYYEMFSGAAPHDFLNLTGGAIGSKMAVSTGAGIARPGCRVVTLVGDGSAMYTVTITGNLPSRPPRPDSNQPILTGKGARSKHPPAEVVIVEPSWAGQRR